MLIQFGQALGDYLYDVFVAKFDFCASWCSGYRANAPDGA